MVENQVEAEHADGPRGPVDIYSMKSVYAENAPLVFKDDEGLELQLTPFAYDILKERYLKKNTEKEVIETPTEMIWRVASSIAKAEEAYSGDVHGWSQRFYRMMMARDFLPNSPTLMNAGTPVGQLSACFVIPIEDDIDEIYEAVRYTAKIHKSGGGVGMSYGRLRPMGDPVGIRSGEITGTSSGPVAFMEVIDASTDAVKQGGRRRGANMSILPIHHPDIVHFIKAKVEEGRLSNMNISVAVTDEFMRAVGEDPSQEHIVLNPRSQKGEPLVTRERGVDGKESDVTWTVGMLFDFIVKNAWNNGEPGIIFIDAINNSASNPIKHVGMIESTNPCVVGDTWVHTTEGPRKVMDLVDRDFDAVVNGKAWGANGFFRTGTKPVFDLGTSEGPSLRLTGNHRIARLPEGVTDPSLAQWVRTDELGPGDRILLNEHGSTGWSGSRSEDEGYLMGLLIGDGTLKTDSAILSSWGDGPGPSSVRERVSSITSNLPSRSDFSGWMGVRDRGEYRLKLAAIRDIALDLGMKDRKSITQAMEECSSAFTVGLLRGLFDADGSVQGTQEKGVSIRLAQSDMETLVAVQRMLLRLGVKSRIYRDRREAGTSLLPDGKGGKREYPVRSQHELVVANEHIINFGEVIGFADVEKQGRLDSSIASYKRTPNREQFIAQVTGVEPAGTEDVFDVQVPGLNAFDANGILAHNCGEQPLLPYESCNLGSINLSNYHLDGEGEWKERVDWDRLRETVSYATRFLDDIVDINQYPLPQIEAMTTGNRRIGLGIMGLADLLIKLHIPYGSKESIEAGEALMKFVHDESWATSRELAEERGVFPNWEGSDFEGRGEKVRNVACTTIAPTGTLSLLANCSSSIEPVFSYAYERMTAFSRFHVVHPLLLEHMEMGGLKDKDRKEIINTAYKDGYVPADVLGDPGFVSSAEVASEEHVAMQAAFQRWVDNGVSKTCNMPFEATVDDVKDIYMTSWKEKCKGITVYRNNSRSQAVLNLGVDYFVRGEASAVRGYLGLPDPAPVKAEQGIDAECPEPKLGKLKKRPRPTRTRGETIQVRTGCGKMYVTINEDDQGICEVFASLGKSGGCEFHTTEALGRLISNGLRSGIDVMEIIEELEDIRCDNPQFNGKPFGMVNSCSDAVAKCIRTYIESKLEDKGVTVQPSLDTFTPGYRLQKVSRKGALKDECLTDGCDSKEFFKYGGCRYCIKCKAEQGCG